MSLSEEFPLLARNEGVWQGYYRYYDPAGNMIDEHLQAQEAKRLNVRVTDKEVDDMLLRLNRQNDLEAGELETMLQRANVDVNALRSKLRAERAWNKVVRQQVSRFALDHVLLGGTEHRRRRRGR